MKKLILSLCLATALFACSNDKKGEGNESAPVAPGADNVNGNLPDTSDAIQLNQSLPKDSSGISDTTR